MRVPTVLTAPVPVTEGPVAVAVYSFQLPSRMTFRRAFAPEFSLTFHWVITPVARTYPALQPSKESWARVQG